MTNKLLTELFTSEQIDYLRGYYQMPAQDAALAGPAMPRHKASLYWAVLEIACVMSMEDAIALTWGQIHTNSGIIYIPHRKPQWDVRSQSFRLVDDEMEEIQMGRWLRLALQCLERSSYVGTPDTRKYTKVITERDVKESFKSFQAIWSTRHGTGWHSERTTFDPFDPSARAAAVKYCVRRAFQEGYPISEIAARMSLSTGEVYAILGQASHTWTYDSNPFTQESRERQEANARREKAEKQRARMKADIRVEYEKKTDPTVISLMFGITYNEVEAIIREIQRDIAREREAEKKKQDDLNERLRKAARSKTYSVYGETEVKFEGLTKEQFEKLKRMWGL